MKRPIHILLLVVAALACVGCAPSGGFKYGEPFVGFRRPIPDKVLVYFYRLESPFFNKEMNVEIEDNGTSVVYLRKDSYFEYETLPGKHEFVFDYVAIGPTGMDRALSVPITLEAGRIYVFRHDSDGITYGVMQPGRDQALVELSFTRRMIK